MSFRFAAAAHRALAVIACLFTFAPAALAATITWIGATNTNWSTPTNWDLGRAPITGDDVIYNGAGTFFFANYDLVGVTLHSITATSNAGTVSGNPIALQSGGFIDDSLPATPLTFNNAVVLNGPTILTGASRFAGVISGTGPVSVEHCADIYFSSSNTYSGSTSVSSNASCNGGRLIVDAPNSIPLGSAVTMANGATVYFEQSAAIASLSGAGAVLLDNASTLTVGGGGTSTTFSGVLFGAGGSLIKTGAGTFTLSGTSTYTGSTTVDAGRLNVALPGVIQSPTTVNAGATLGGTGTINAPVAVNTNGMLAPGLSPGIFNTGNLNLTGTLQVEVSGPTAGTQYDQVNVTGTVNVTNAAFVLTVGAVTGGSVFTIIKNDGADPVIGTFLGVPQGSTFSVGGTVFAVSYTGGDGNDVTLTAMTAPGAPAIGTATPGNGQATIAFTAPASNGGSAITGYTATCNPGNITAPGGALATSIVVPGLANGTPYTCSVTATNAIGTSVASGTVGVTPFIPAVTAFSGPSATGTGTINASFTGGGAGCSFTAAQFIPVTGNPASPPGPAPAVFPHGLFDFTLGGCTPASTITMTIVYPAALPAGTQYWKYGPTPGNPAGGWYVMPSAITGNTVVFSITDGGVGDDDLAANGTIVDQGGPGIPGAPGQVDSIPTLQEWALMLLALMLMSSGLYYARYRRLL